MAALNDHSCGISIETTYGVAVAPTHFFEWLESSKLDYDPNIIYSKGLKVGSRFPRASRRVGLVPKPDGKLDFEVASKSFGVILEAAFGTGTWTAITGGGQELFTATTTGSTLPSFTTQEGLVRADGTVIAHTWRGCTVKKAEFSMPLDGFLELSLDVDTKVMHITRTVADGVTNSTTLVTSATAAFDASDVGAPISGTGIPAATTIAAVVSATNITLSQAATSSGSGVALTIGSPYVTPTYASGATLFSSTANPSLANIVLGGTLTVPTTTALGSIAGGTTVLAVKNWKLTLDNKVTPREAIGTRNQPTTGERTGEIEMEIEYDATTGTLLENAMVKKTAMPLLLSAETTEVISTSGYATFQLAIPSVAIDGGAIPQPTSGGVATTTIKFSILDGEVAAAQLYAVLRTADVAL